MVEKGVSECKAEGVRWRKAWGSWETWSSMYSTLPCPLVSPAVCTCGLPYFWGFLFSLFAWLTLLRS